MDDLTATASIARLILKELRENGASVQLVEPDTLKVSGEGAVSVVARLRVLKAPVVAYLKEAPTWPCPKCARFAFPAPEVVCYWCARSPPSP